jgi:hypothetical protein
MKGTREDTHGLHYIKSNWQKKNYNYGNPNSIVMQVIKSNWQTIL